MDIVQGVAVVVSEAGSVEVAERIAASIDGATTSMEASFAAVSVSASVCAEQMTTAMSTASTRMAAAQTEGANVGASARIMASQRAMDIETRARGIAVAQSEAAAAKLAVINDGTVANTEAYSAKLIALAQTEAEARIALGDTVAYKVAVNTARSIVLAEDEKVARIAEAEEEAASKIALAEKVALAQIKASEKAEAAELKRIEREAAARAEAAAEAAGINPVIISTVTSAAPLLLAAGAALGLTELTKNAIETAAAMEHLSHRTGVSVSDLSVLNVAAKESGMDVESLGQVFKRLDTNVDKALHGNLDVIRNFKETLKIQDTPDLMNWINTTTPMDKLHQLATALDGIQNQEERIAKAQELMGGRGGASGGAANLLFFLHQLAGDGFAKVTEEATRLGVVIDEQTGNSALRFEQEWSRVKLEMMGVGLAIAEGVLPSLHSLTNSVTADEDSGFVGFVHTLTVAIKLLSVALDATWATLKLISGYTVVKSFVGMVSDAASGKQSKDIVPVDAWKRITSDFRNATDPFAPTKPAAGSEFEKMMGHDTVAPKDPEAEQRSLSVAQDQLAVARAMNAEAHAGDALDNLRLGNAVKMLEIQQQLDQQIKSIPKDDSADTKAKLTADFQATADQKRSAEAENYNRARASMVRLDESHLASLAAELDIQRMQVTAASTYDSINQAQIDHEIRLATIRKDGAAAVAGVDPHADNAKKLRDNAQQSTLNQIAQENAAYQMAQERQQYADAQRLSAQRLQTNEALRGVDIAQRTADLTELQRTKVMTLTDVQRKADLERQNALDEFNAKADQTRDSGKTAITDLAMGTDYLDPFSIGRFADQAVEINTRTTATLITARIAYQSQISQIDATADQGRATSRTAFNYSEQEQLLADYQKFADALAPILGAPIGKIVAFWRKALDEQATRARQINTNAASDIAGSVQELFAGATGQKSWGQAFTSIAGLFQKSMGDALNAVVKSWTDRLGRQANGQPEIAYASDGTPYLTDANPGQTASARNTLRAVQIGGAALGVGMQGYAAGFSGTPGARTQGVVSGAVTGATTGMELFAAAGPIAGFYGAIIGAVVGLVAGAIGAAQRQADYQYGVPTFMSGTASITGGRNLTQAQQDQMTAQLQTAFNDSWNAFTKIALKLPSAQLPTMPDGFADSFQPNPSAHWAEHFSEYLSTTLPAEIAGMFKSGMETSFVASGMTSAAFEAFWAEADTMDPTKRAQFWSDMADGIVALDRAAQNMKAINSFTLGAPARFDSLGNAMTDGESQFSADTKVAATNLYAIARQMVNMTGADKAAAFKALGDGIQGLTKSLQDFLVRVGQVRTALNQTFADARMEMSIAQFGEVTDAQGNVITPEDKNAEAKILSQRADENLYQINHAAQLGLTPEDVQNLTNQTIGLFQRLYALDPSQQAYEWWQRQMNTLQNASNVALTDLGQQAKTAVEKILITMQPFEDWFLGLPVNLDPAWAALDTSITGAADALGDLARVLKAAAAGAGTGSGTQQPGVGQGGDGPYDPPYVPPIDRNGDAVSQPANVTVIVQQSIGLEDFKSQMTAAAAAAFRNDPSLLERNF